MCVFRARLKIKILDRRHQMACSAEQRPETSKIRPDTKTKFCKVMVIPSVILQNRVRGKSVMEKENGIY